MNNLEGASGLCKGQGILLYLVVVVIVQSYTLKGISLSRRYPAFLSVVCCFEGLFI